MSPPIGGPRAGYISGRRDAIPDEQVLHARYDFSEYSGTSGLSDLTENGYDLVNGSITSVSESINGVQAGEFDGTDDTVYTDPFTTITQPYSVYGVARLDDAAQQSALWQLATGSASNKLLLEWGTSNYRIFAGSLLNGSTNSGTLLFGAIYDGTNSQIREDGVQTNSGDAGSRDMDVIGIGSTQPDEASRFWTGAIGEVLVYPDGDTSRISDVESYLSDKWGVTI